MLPRERDAAPRRDRSCGRRSCRRRRSARTTKPDGRNGRRPQTVRVTRSGETFTGASRGRPGAGSAPARGGCRPRRGWRRAWRARGGGRVGRTGARPRTGMPGRIHGGGSRRARARHGGATLRRGLQPVSLSTGNAGAHLQSTSAAPRTIHAAPGAGPGGGAAELHLVVCSPTGACGQRLCPSHDPGWQRRLPPLPRGRAEHTGDHRTARRAGGRCRIEPWRCRVDPGPFRRHGHRRWQGRGGVAASAPASPTLRAPEVTVTASTAGAPAPHPTRAREKTTPARMRPDRTAARAPRYRDARATRRLDAGDRSAWGPPNAAGGPRFLGPRNHLR